MKTLFVKDYLSTIATTRSNAKELIELARKSKVEAISLKDIEFASRSFLHELTQQASENSIKVVDYNKNITKLITAIRTSSKTHVIAPTLEIERAAPLKI